MLNISNLERISEILGMKPENITEFDIDDASDELDPNSEEWLIMIEALRELDGGKSGLLFEACNNKRQKQIRKYEDIKLVKNSAKSIGKYILKNPDKTLRMVSIVIPDIKVKLVAEGATMIFNGVRDLKSQSIENIDCENIKSLKEDVSKLQNIGNKFYEETKKSYNEITKNLKRK